MVPNGQITMQDLHRTQSNTALLTISFSTFFNASTGQASTQGAFSHLRQVN